MEWLSAFAGSGGIPTLLLAFVIVILVSIMIKKGLLSVHTKGIDIGQDQKTRELILAQFEYSQAKVEGVIPFLPDHLNEATTKWILSRVEDVFQKAIVLNQMSTKNTYVKTKQELVYQTVLKRVTDPFFKTEDFKVWVYKFTKELIEDLVEMKKDYE